MVSQAGRQTGTGTGTNTLAADLWLTRAHCVTPALTDDHDDDDEDEDEVECH